jgi:transposase
MRTADRAAVRTLATLNESIREYDRQIEQLAKAHPDFAIFNSLPGAGDVLVPRLIAAFGTQRDRYANAAEIQQYTGIAPVTEASGQQHWVHWRWSCPKFLRQTFHEWANQSILYCDWAEAYYRAQRDDKNKSHHAAVRSLAYKWMPLPSAAGRTVCRTTTRDTKRLWKAAARPRPSRDRRRRLSCLSGGLPMEASKNSF